MYEHIDKDETVYLVYSSKIPVMHYVTDGEKELIQKHLKEIPVVVEILPNKHEEVNSEYKFYARIVFEFKDWFPLSLEEILKLVQINGNVINNTNIVVLGNRYDFDIIPSLVYYKLMCDILKQLERCQIIIPMSYKKYDPLFEEQRLLNIKQEPI